MNFRLYSNNEISCMHHLAKQHWQHRMDRLAVATAKYQEIKSELERRGI